MEAPAESPAPQVAWRPAPCRRRGPLRPLRREARARRAGYPQQHRQQERQQQEHVPGSTCLAEDGGAGPAGDLRFRRERRRPGRRKRRCGASAPGAEGGGGRGATEGAAKVRRAVGGHAAKVVPVEMRVRRTDGEGGGSSRARRPPIIAPPLLLRPPVFSQCLTMTEAGESAPARSGLAKSESPPTKGVQLPFPPFPTPTLRRRRGGRGRSSLPPSSPTTAWTRR